jgi:hypothetical protein
MTDNEYQANLEAALGPEASFTDHKPGETIRYHCGEEIRTGEIIYVQAPHEVVSEHMPLTYVVDSGHGFPDFVYQTDVIEEIVRHKDE